MAKKGPQHVSNALKSTLEPMLARRAGMNMALLADWETIAGRELATGSRPLKINWRQRHLTQNEDHVFQGGILIIACEGSKALFLMHSKAHLIDKVNMFFGFPAICDVKFVQKPVVSFNSVKKPIQITKEESNKIETMTKNIDHADLKTALNRLGQAIFKKNHALKQGK